MKAHLHKDEYCIIKYYSKALMLNLGKLKLFSSFSVTKILYISE